MDKLKENLPLISAMLLILGAARLIFFYSYFGIDITSYIDLAEIFSLSLRFFATSALIFVPFGFFYLPTALVMDIRVKSKFRGYREDIDAITPVEGVVATAMSFILFMLTYFMFTGYMDFTVTIDMALLMVLIFILPWTTQTFLPILQDKLNKIFKTDLSNSFFAGIILVLSVSIFAIAVSRHSARNMAYAKKFISAEVQIDDKVIRSSDGYRYIGKTKNYIFFYNRAANKSDAFSLANVKRVTLSDDRFFTGMMMQPDSIKTAQLKPAKTEPIQTSPSKLKPER